MTTSSDRDARLTAEHRLAVYGTLAPGRPNAHVMADIPGVWIDGTVRGTLVEQGWGATQGYPGIRLDDAPASNEATDVACVMFESAELPQHWAMLDDFEGDGYRRVVTQVRTADGVREAFIYELSGL